MRIHNLYTDAKGESHFRDMEIEWVEQRRGGKLSKRLPATGVIFGRPRLSTTSTDIRRRAGSTSSTSRPG